MKTINAFPRYLAVFFALVCTLILAGCSSSPEEVVQKYYRAVVANRVDEAVSYYSLKEFPHQDLTHARQKLGGLVTQQNRLIQQNGGFDSIQTSIVKQDENTALVKVVMKFKNGRSHEGQIRLVQDGGWKISPR